MADYDWEPAPSPTAEERRAAKERYDEAVQRAQYLMRGFAKRGLGATEAAIIVREVARGHARGTGDGVWRELDRLDLLIGSDRRGEELITVGVWPNGVMSLNVAKDPWALYAMCQYAWRVPNNEIRERIMSEIDAVLEQVEADGRE